MCYVVYRKAKSSNSNCWIMAYTEYIIDSSIVYIIICTNTYLVIFTKFNNFLYCQSGLKSSLIFKSYLQIIDKICLIHLFSSWFKLYPSIIHLTQIMLISFYYFYRLFLQKMSWICLKIWMTVHIPVITKSMELHLVIYLLKIPLTNYCVATVKNVMIIQSLQHLNN